MPEQPAPDLNDHDGDKCHEGDRIAIVGDANDLATMRSVSLDGAPSTAGVDTWRGARPLLAAGEMDHAATGATACGGGRLGVEGGPTTLARDGGHRSSIAPRRSEQVEPRSPTSGAAQPIAA